MPKPVLKIQFLERVVGLPVQQHKGPRFHNSDHQNVAEQSTYIRFSNSELPLTRDNEVLRIPTPSDVALVCNPPEVFRMHDSLNRRDIVLV